MDPLPVFIDPVKTSVRDSIATGNIVAVIGELFSGRKEWSFAYDFVPLDHKLAAISVCDHPFASAQRHRPVGGVFDRNEIDECMWLVCRE